MASSTTTIFPSSLSEAMFVAKKAKFPEDYPAQDTTHILTIHCGSTKLFWALHGGPEHAFYPVMFWQTPVVPPSPPPAAAILPEQGPSPGSSPTKTAAEEVQKQLPLYFPDRARHLLWGHYNSKNNSKRNAITYRNSLRIPMLFVYTSVMSNSNSNQTNDNDCPNELAVSKLLCCLPFVVLRRLVSLPSPPMPNLRAITATTTTQDTEDRITHVAASQTLYPNATAIMVIDGSPVLTYTCATKEDRNDDNRNDSSPCWTYSGGTSAGLRMKFQSLYDFMPELPSIHAKLLKDTIAQCETAQRPLSTLSACSGDDMIADTGTQHDMIGTALLETAVFLMQAIRTFVDSPTDDHHELPVVVLTGSDADLYYKLLMSKHSNLIEASSDPTIRAFWEQAFMDSGDGTPIPPNKKFRIVRHRHLVHTVATETLKRHAFWPNENNSSGSGSDVEATRQHLLGQRVLMRTQGMSDKKNAGCGTIVFVVRSENDSLDDDLFAVMYDNNPKLEAVDKVPVTRLYDMLMEYHKMQGGETYRCRKSDKMGRIRYLNKVKDAKEAADVLEAASRSVKRLVMSRKPKTPPPPVHHASPFSASAGSNEGSRQKKARTTPNAAFMPEAKRKSSSAKRASAKEKSEEKVNYVGRRMAKQFESDSGIDDLYFGTVKDSWTDEKGVELWSIEYDDEDFEDLDRRSLLKCLALYDRNKLYDVEVSKKPRAEA